MKDLEILAGLEWCQTILSESEARFEALLSAGPNKEDGKVIESFREYMGNSFDFFTDLRENPGQVISLYLKMENIWKKYIESGDYKFKIDRYPSSLIEYMIQKKHPDWLI